MNVLRALAALLMFGAAPAAAAAPAWTIDPGVSSITFTARQMQVTIPFRFQRFSAAIDFDANDLAGSKARIEIDVASVSTPNLDIEKEIKGEPWFDARRHPTATFETTAFTHKGGDAFDAVGQLTLRGVTKPVTLALTIRIADDPDRPNMLRAHATGEVVLSRTAFEIGQGQWRDVGVVADEVVVRLEVVARRPKTAP